MTEALGLNQSAGCGFCPETDLYQRSFLNAARISVDLHRESTISIVTREGDRVTLFSARDFDLTYSRAGSIETSAETLSWSGSESIACSSSQEFSLAVEGDLSTEERKDIRKALQQIESIIRGAFAGNTVAKMPSAQNSGGIGSLACVEAYITIESSVTQLQQVTSSVASASTALPGDSLARAMTAAGKEPALESSPPSGSGADDIAAAMIEAVNRSSCASKAFFRPVDRLFSRYAKIVAAEKRHPAADLLRLSDIREAFRERLGLAQSVD